MQSEKIKLGGLEMVTKGNSPQVGAAGHKVHEYPAQFPYEGPWKSP